MATMRRQGRTFAVQMLYQLEMEPPVGETGFPAFWRGQGASRKLRAFTEELVEATRTHQAAIDETLRSHLTEWRLERLPVVVRAILRLAACELTILRSEPRAAIINEAVDLTRAFQDAESASFVNAVLDKFPQVPPPAAAPAGEEEG